MNKNVKKKLIAALLSGNYEKGRGRLRSTRNRFCVEGILCDLYKQETGKGEWTTFPANDYPFLTKTVNFVINNEVDGHLLPLTVSKWVGKTWSKSLGMSLIELNDLIGLNFGDLAEVVRFHF